MRMWSHQHPKMNMMWVQEKSVQRVWSHVAQRGDDRDSDDSGTTYLNQKLPDLLFFG
jgi:hypothetical protein